MRVLLASVVVGTLAACAFPTGSALPPPCVQDADCPNTEVCFPDGCGDPGKNLVVEVTANTRTGQHAQDFAVADGSLRPPYDIEISAPMGITGEVLRESTAAGDPTQRVLYVDPFVVRATGESALIPGVTRSFEQTFTRPERGAFSMPVASGNYTVTAIAVDASIPPMAKTQVSVVNGVDSQVNFVFPSIDGSLTITGRLIEHLEQAVPPVEVALTQAVMQLEAIDTVTKRPLSQVTSTSSGLSGSRGDFVLSVDPAAKLMSNFLVVARPKDSAAVVPTRTFTMTKPYPSGPVLQMGDFGKPLTLMLGQVVGTDGSPVVGASVYFEGLVTGGATYRSRTVVSDDNGLFRVDLLPSPYDSSYTMTVLPLSKSSAGVLTVSAKAQPVPGGNPELVPAKFVCPDKLTVAGSVKRPDGALAAQVLLLATAVKAVDGRPLPTEATETVTDESGRFSFNLDPAVYRFDFQPGEDLPRMSRYVTVHSPPGKDAGSAPVGTSIDLGEFTLSKGRRVSGTVTSAAYPNMTQAEAANATVRFFRLTQIDGKPGAQLLGEAVTDARGYYGVVLPGTPSP